MQLELAPARHYYGVRLSNCRVKVGRTLMSDTPLVYVIDDDAQVRTSLQVILETNNCRVSLHGTV